jgi:hypothetical protein
MIFEADWSVIRASVAELNKYLSSAKRSVIITSETEGWITHPASGDTMLVSKVGASKYGAESWSMSVWNGRDPRKEWGRAIALPDLR